MGKIWTFDTQFEKTKGMSTFAIILVSVAGKREGHTSLMQYPLDRQMEVSM